MFISISRDAFLGSGLEERIRMSGTPKQLDFKVLGTEWLKRPPASATLHFRAVTPSQGPSYTVAKTKNIIVKDSWLSDNVYEVLQFVNGARLSARIGSKGIIAVTAPSSGDLERAVRDIKVGDYRRNVNDLPVYGWMLVEIIKNNRSVR